jgi:hypothetical protein
MVGVILLLNVWDIVNTLHIISSPSEEINPAMRVALEHSIMMFVGVKIVLVGGGSMILAKYLPKILHYIIVLYTCIILYQLFVIFYLTSF